MSRGREDARRRRARAISKNGAVDLSAAGMSDERAWREQAKLELALGKRCFGCGRRIGVGLRFLSIDVTDPQHPAIHRSACTREDCDFAERARDGATVMEVVEFAWLDSYGLDAPAFGIGMTPAKDGRPSDGSASAADADR